MKFTGIFLIFWVGIIFEQQIIGLCYQMNQMHLYCTNQDQSAVVGSNPMASRIRTGKSGPRGRRGPPGKIPYDAINSTIEQYFQELKNEMRTKLSAVESMLIEKDQEISELKSELTNKMRTKLSAVESMLIVKDQEISELKSGLKRIENLIMNDWYKSSIEYYYKVFNDKVNYTNAKLNCSRHGANLASVGIRDPIVFSELVALVKSSGSLNTWIGLDDVQTEGKYIWSDGLVAEAGNIPWHGDQPNNLGGNQDCVEMASSWEFKLNDDDCTHNFRYVCEIKF